ncbi:MULTISPECIES: cell division protein FtsL [Lactobacillus]|uniref:Cell division protein FtsL n=1 Tax=Lactobacillus xujianguonis TaxID=2495899 RepID=A0A437STN8_9LACO|nr:MULTISPECIES: cell division protein FtsL [Lactobacillus]RVU70309.1 cell division protein FtsL [Lactobacillus xujianguonis]RVU73875.1 cell division protein FtsL [Lactobacillus xujianguonis]
MADSSARRIELEPNKQTEFKKRRRIAPNPHQVSWTGLERTLVILGSVVAIAMMIFLVSSSISATSAQHELSDVQQAISTEQNNITDLHQQIGELTSSSRLNKIARAKGLTLIEKNIRTIR